MYSDIPRVDTSKVWQCCGGVSSEEEPSFYTLWEDGKLVSRILDPLCEDLPIPIAFPGTPMEAGPPPIAGRIETQSIGVADRLHSIFKSLSIDIQVKPDCIGEDAIREHACLLWNTIVPRQMLRSVPPATASRAGSALAALMEAPASLSLPGPAELAVENLVDIGLLLTVQHQKGRLDIRPMVPSRKLDAIRLRTRRFCLLGTEWDWLLASSRKGPLSREQVDVLCGMSEVLLSLGRDGLPTEPRRLLLGNWLRMPRQVTIVPRSVAKAA